MTIKIELARKAYKSAIQERRNAGINPASSICVFDLIYERGVEIRFQNISSMEGLYYNDGKPLILVSSCRPRGRVAFTCAHEYGHHVFGHGNRIDEVLDSKLEKRWEPDEFLADCFAGFLLMPKLAICNAFSSRGWDIEHCTPEQAFIISGYMGTGYHSLLTHMYSSLRIMSRLQFEMLTSVTPKSLKSKLTGFEYTGEVVVFDRNWEQKAIDLCIGDILIAPNKSIIEGACIEFVNTCPTGLVYKAFAQGLDRIQDEEGRWASHIRVSRTFFEGLVQYRHFPEVHSE
jgi:Zn-dependent peptidase ImmA (M78 family)